jgi:hypothetical protein
LRVLIPTTVQKFPGNPEFLSEFPEFLSEFSGISGISGRKIGISGNSVFLDRGRNF